MGGVGVSEALLHMSRSKWIIKERTERTLKWMNCRHRVGARNKDSGWEGLEKISERTNVGEGDSGSGGESKSARGRNAEIIS